MPKFIKCSNCGTDVKLHNNSLTTRTFCSVTCIKESKAKMKQPATPPETTPIRPVEEVLTPSPKPEPEQLICKNCGVSFTPRNRRGFPSGYCSKTCIDEIKITKRPRVQSMKQCAQCGASFLKPIHNAIYCSTDCAAIAKTDKQRERNKREALAPKPCEHCQQEFMPKRSNTRFCSRKCINAAHHIRLQQNAVVDSIQCPTCGATIEKPTHNQTYCSDQCRYDGRYLGRPRGVNPTRSCVVCSEVFKPRAPKQVICSQKCKDAKKEFDMAEREADRTHLVAMIEHTSKQGEDNRAFHKMVMAWKCPPELLDQPKTYTPRERLAHGVSFATQAKQLLGVF